MLLFWKVAISQTGCCYSRPLARCVHWNEKTTSTYDGGSFCYFSCTERRALFHHFASAHVCWLFAYGRKRCTYFVWFMFLPTFISLQATPRFQSQQHETPLPKSCNYTTAIYMRYTCLSLTQHRGERNDVSRTLRDSNEKKFSRKFH